MPCVSKAIRDPPNRTLAGVVVVVVGVVGVVYVDVVVVVLGFPGANPGANK